jgi:glutamate-ammonia-ligase adenylyltransferase
MTQALVTALSAPMADGRLYEVDMRLRPSGRQGPVATSLDSFRDYQENEAWTWEHLALTRARAVAGDGAISDEVEAFRGSLLPDKGRRAEVLRDVAEMRARLAAAKPGAGVWDTKDGAGHAMDIALFAQVAALRAGSLARQVDQQLQAGVVIGWLDAAHVQELMAYFGLFGGIQAASRLLSHGVLDPESIGEGGQRMVLRETGFEDMAALETALSQAQGRCQAIISGYIGAADEG